MAQTQDCSHASPAISLLPPLTHPEQSFHAIRSREDLALVLFDWEFVNSEDNLYGLFDLIHKTNSMLDENHAVKKLNQAAKAQEN